MSWFKSPFWVIYASKFTAMFTQESFGFSPHSTYVLIYLTVIIKNVKTVFHASHEPNKSVNMIIYSFYVFQREYKYFITNTKTEMIHNLNNEGNT